MLIVRVDSPVLHDAVRLLPIDSAHAVETVDRAAMTNLKPVMMRPSLVRALEIGLRFVVFGAGWAFRCISHRLVLLLLCVPSVQSFVDRLIVKWRTHI